MHHTMMINVITITLSRSLGVKHSKRMTTRCLDSVVGCQCENSSREHHLVAHCAIKFDANQQCRKTVDQYFAAEGQSRERLYNAQGYTYVPDSKCQKP
jgi:hypothetical protein